MGPEVYEMHKPGSTRVLINAAAESAARQPKSSYVGNGRRGKGS